MNTKIDEKARAVKREYLRNWRKANPEKVRNAQLRYWLRKAEQLLAEEEFTNNAEKSDSVIAYRKGLNKG